MWLNYIKNRLVLFSVALAILYFGLVFFSLGRSPVVTRGEGREGQVVLAMERTKDFILPLRNGTTVPSKPPLFHWISTLGVEISDQVGEAEIRFPSALAAATILGCFFYFVAKIANPLSAVLSISIIGTSLEFIRYSTQSRVDMVFAACLTLSLIFLYRLVENERTFFIEILCICSLALAILSKGPFGLIIPSLIIFIHIFTGSSKSKIVDIFRLIPCFFLATLIAGCWYLLAYRQLGEEFLKMQLFRENLSRVANVDGEELGHAKPFYYSFVYLIMTVLPWSIFLPRLSYSFQATKYLEYWKTNRLFRYSNIWLLVFLFAVSLSVSKRSVYFLPALPPVGFLLAFFLQEKVNSGFPRFVGIIENIFVKIIQFCVIACLASSFFVFLVLPKIFSGMEAEKLLIFKQFLSDPVNYVALAIISLWSLKLKANDRIESFVLKLASIAFLIFLFGQYQIAPLVFAEESPRQFAGEVNELLLNKSEGNVKIYQFEDEFFAPVFYLKTNAPIVTQQEILEIADPEFFLLISEKRLSSLEKIKPNYEQVLSSRNKLANRRELLYLVNVKN